MMVFDIDKKRPTMNLSEFYYNNLSNCQKKIYEDLLICIKGFKKEVALPLVSMKTLYLIFESILLDNPELFFIDSIDFISECTKLKTMARPIYKNVINNSNFYKKHIGNSLKLFDLVKHKSDLEKVLYVHDYCIRNLKYDYSFDKLSYSVLGIIINGFGVCEGISKFVKVALNYLGVDCMVVSGDAVNHLQNSKDFQPHMWNIV